MNDEKALAAAKNYAAALQNVRSLLAHKEDMLYRWDAASDALEEAESALAKAVVELQEALIDE